MTTDKIDDLNIAILEMFGVSTKRLCTATIRLECGRLPTIVAEYVGDPNLKMPQCLEHKLKCYTLEPIKSKIDG
jgi:hypothetical protein